MSTSNASKDAAKWLLTHCCWECKMIQPLWKNSLEASLKKNNQKTTKHALNIRTSNFSLSHLFRRNKDVCSRKNLCKNVYSNFILIKQEVERTQMSFHRWTSKQIGISIPLTTTQQLKRKNYWYMQCPGWISRELG